MIDYIASINDTDKEKVLLLIDASLQAYNAFDTKDPLNCQIDKIVPPVGFDFVECWTGVDEIFGHEKTTECYGVVFRSQAAPHHYIFAFRGTASVMDVLDDLGAKSKPFKAYEQSVAIAPGVAVESGFFDVYSTDNGTVPSMQEQLFGLIDKYQASDKPIGQLLITGHSLGSALSELFTLDIALSRPSVSALNINYACPRVGNRDFVAFYESQPAQNNSNTRTLRVQNTYDKVPCVPLEDMGYKHISPAYLIAFYKDSWTGKLNFIDCHSSANYSAVLNCAVQSEEGICVCESLEVPANRYSVTSTKPDAQSVCSYW